MIKSVNVSSLSSVNNKFLSKCSFDVIDKARRSIKSLHKNRKKLLAGNAEDKLKFEKCLKDLDLKLALAKKFSNFKLRFDNSTFSVSNDMHRDKCSNILLMMQEIRKDVGNVRIKFVNINQISKSIISAIFNYLYFGGLTHKGPLMFKAWDKIGPLFKNFLYIWYCWNKGVRSDQVFFADCKNMEAELYMKGLISEQITTFSLIFLWILKLQNG
jgi:hypothetical protein